MLSDTVSTSSRSIAKSDAGNPMNIGFELQLDFGIGSHDTGLGPRVPWSILAQGPHFVGKVYNALTIYLEGRAFALLAQLLLLGKYGKVRASVRH